MPPSLGKIQKWSTDTRIETSVKGVSKYLYWNSRHCILRETDQQFELHFFNEDENKFLSLDPERMKLLNDHKAEGRFTEKVESVVSVHNGFIFLWRKLVDPQLWRLYAFSSESLKWKMCYSQSFIGLPSSVVVVDNMLYSFQYDAPDVTVYQVEIGTWDARKHEEMIFVQNGSATLVFGDIDVFTVALYADGTYDVLQSLDEPRTMFRLMDDKETFQLYEGIYYELLTFEVGSVANEDVIAIKTTDNAIYQAYQTDYTFGIRKAYRKPTLEMMCMEKVIDEVLKLEDLDDAEGVRDRLPYPLRPLFDRMADWRIYEEELKREEKAQKFLTQFCLLMVLLVLFFVSWLYSSPDYYFLSVPFRLLDFLSSYF